MKEENFKELDKVEFKELLKNLSKGQDEVFGSFRYGDYIITIKRPKGINNLRKSRRFYQNRKEQGLCVYCGTKVKELNPKTKQPMRYCADHRKMESNLKKVRRLEGLLLEEKNTNQKAALAREIKNLRKEAELFLVGDASRKVQKKTEMSPKPKTKKTAVKKK